MSDVFLSSNSQKSRSIAPATTPSAAATSRQFLVAFQFCYGQNELYDLEKQLTFQLPKPAGCAAAVLSQPIVSIVLRCGSPGCRQQHQHCQRLPESSQLLPILLLS